MKQRLILKSKYQNKISKFQFNATSVCRKCVKCIQNEILMLPGKYKLQVHVLCQRGFVCDIHKICEIFNAFAQKSVSLIAIT